MKSKITNFHTFRSSPSLHAGLQNPHERRACTLLTEILVSHGKFVRMSNEAGRLPFRLTRSSHVQLKYSETREKAKKENKPKQRNLNLLLVELIKTNYNVLANSVKKKVSSITTSLNHALM